MNKWVIWAPILAWYLWVRFRRNVGRQKLRLWRLLASPIAFGLLTIGFAGPCLTRPALALGWAGGLVLGAALGWLALRLTRFESTAEGQFYTPNAHIGFLLFVVFVARMAYRFSVLGGSEPIFESRPIPAFGYSALTYLIFEVLAGYYLAYNLGVLRRFRALAAVPPA
ncbi:MAG TPA: hypothetical protein VHC86_16525 [Opitutaceae bacterium]|nr:hypothetical protein [Opitutaceae bacterium]